MRTFVGFKIIITYCPNQSNLAVKVKTPENGGTTHIFFFLVTFPPPPFNEAGTIHMGAHTSSSRTVLGLWFCGIPRVIAQSDNSIDAPQAWPVSGGWRGLLEISWHSGPTRSAAVLTVGKLFTRRADH